jgi:hypothetical protein
MYRKKPLTVEASEHRDFVLAAILILVPRQNAPSVEKG